MENSSGRHLQFSHWGHNTCHDIFPCLSSRRKQWKFSITFPKRIKIIFQYRVLTHPTHGIRISTPMAIIRYFNWVISYISHSFISMAISTHLRIKKNDDNDDVQCGRVDIYKCFNKKTKIYTTRMHEEKLENIFKKSNVHNGQISHLMCSSIYNSHVQCLLSENAQDVIYAMMVFQCNQSRDY